MIGGPNLQAVAVSAQTSPYVRSGNGYMPNVRKQPTLVSRYLGRHLVLPLRYHPPALVGSATYLRRTVGDLTTTHGRLVGPVCRAAGGGGDAGETCCKPNRVGTGEAKDLARYCGTEPPTLPLAVSFGAPPHPAGRLGTGPALASVLAFHWRRFPPLVSIVSALPPGGGGPSPASVPVIDKLSIGLPKVPSRIA